MFKKIFNNLTSSVIAALVVVAFIVGIGLAVSGGGMFTAGDINKGLVFHAPLKGLLGDELVTNGTFDSDSDWIKESGWTISGGTANFNTGGSNNRHIAQDIGITSGKIYFLEFDVASISAGEASFRLSGMSGVDEITASSVGHYSGNITATASADGSIMIEDNDNAFIGSIDNVSVKEVLPSKVGEDIVTSFGSGSNAPNSSTYNSAQSFDATVNDGAAHHVVSQSLSLTSGETYTIGFDVTLNSGALTDVTIRTGADTSLTLIGGLNQTISAGSNNFTFTMGATDSTARIGFRINTDCDIEIRNFHIGRTKTPDKTPHANYGTIYGATQNADNISFDGSDDVVKVSNNTTNTFGGGNSFTYSAWIYANNPTNSSNWQGIIYHGNANESQGHMGIEKTTGYLSGGTGESGATWVTKKSTQLIPTNTWCHITETLDRDSSTLKLYYNGSVVYTDSSYTYVPDSTSDDLLIGDGSTLSTEDFEGKIKDVRIYDRALSATEVTSLYNLGGRRNIVQVGTKSKGLVGHWELSKESESVGSDLTVNPNLDISGASWQSYQMTRTWDANYGWDGGGLRYAWDNTTHGVVETNYITTTAGQRYVMSMKFKADVNNDFDYSSTSAFSSFAFKTGGSADQGTDYSSIEITALGDGWYQWTRQFTAVTTGVSGLIYAYKPGNSIPRNVFVDDGFVREVYITDSTPNANKGTVYGASYTTDRKSQANQAMSFDGVDEYVYRGVSDFEVDDNNGAITAWIRTNSNTNYPTIFATSDESTSVYFMVFNLEETSGKLRFIQRNNDTQDTVIGDAVLSDNSWHHVVIQSNGEEYIFYVDGILENTNIVGGGNSGDWFADTLNRDNITIGRLVMTGSGNYEFNGSIDDVRVYDRVLSSVEVQSLYNSYKPKITAGSLYKGLVLHMPLKSENEKVGDELITNGNMELDSNWANYTGAEAINERSSTYAHSGTYSRRFYLSSAVTGGIRSANFSTITGKSYEVNFWVYSPDNSSCRVAIRQGDGATWAKDTGTLNFTQSSWTKKTINYNEVVGGSGAYFVVHSNNQAGNWYVDNVSIKEVQTADKTPNANHGTVYGATQNTNDMSFDGTDDKVVIGDPSLLNITEKITLAAWFNVNSMLFDYQPLISKGDNTYRLQRNYNTNFMAFGTTGLSNIDLNGDFNVNDGAWHLAVAVYDGSTKYLYIDGMLDASVSATGSISTSTREVEIGHNSQITTRYWDGEIKDVRIYNRALSTGEIEQLYNQSH